MNMLSNYTKALKKGDSGAIFKLVIFLVLAWVLYNYIYKKKEGYCDPYDYETNPLGCGSSSRGPGSTTFDPKIDGLDYDDRSSWM